MLALQKCRELLGAEADNLTDNELEAVRDALYGVAAVAVNAYPSREFVTPREAFALLCPNEREVAEERAAILEFDGGLSRPAAEQRALAEAFERRSVKAQLREIA